MTSQSPTIGHAKQSVGGFGQLSYRLSILSELPPF